MSVPCYVVAGCRPWSRRVFDERLSRLPGRWEFAGTPEELTAERMARLRPRYIFLLHWSWKVPAEFVERYECVGFHMTDLPYGRGGSPLQNLIVRGHRDTRLSALRLDSGMDSGPIYLKCDLALDGSAEEIYRRCSELAAEMVVEIVEASPEPYPQSGEPVTFRRRRPAQSRLPESANLTQAYDFIRMLDAEGYPHAFVEQGGLRFEMRGARLDGDELTARVRISVAQGNDSIEERSLAAARES